jgi:hypothetical protein
MMAGEAHNSLTSLVRTQVAGTLEGWTSGAVGAR